MVTGSSAWARAVSRSAVKLGEPRPEPGNRLGQLPHVPAGEELLVGVVLPQGREPLELGVRLGERQDGRVARGDGLHLGVRELLAADVLGLPDARSRPSSPGR